MLVLRLGLDLQALFVPLVDKLGYDYTDEDSTDTSLLRTCAITQAAAAKDPAWVLHMSSPFASLILFLLLVYNFDLDHSITFVCFRL